MTPILSILIPTIPSRIKMFDFVSDKVTDQIMQMEKMHPTLGAIEFLYHEGGAYLNGGLSIGKKRQELVEMSTGKYLCFLDDDEDIAPNYVETLVRLCQSDADVITFRSFAKTDFYWSVIDMRLGNPNEEATPERIVKRNWWHICPVKSEIAKRHSFPDINYGEDAEWISKVVSDCKTEAHTDQILHQYNHSSKTSEADKIINAGHK